MEVNNKKDTPAIIEWLGDDRGDNLAIRFGLRVYTVDRFGNLNSQRYKRALASPLPEGTYTTPIEGLSDLKPGHTFVISNTEIVVGKLIESHLFGYRFLCVTPEGKIMITDVSYEDIIRHHKDGDIKAIFKVRIED